MTDALFTPVRVGAAQLTHRIVLAPLTRMRADAEHVPSALAPEYYAQRAATPGTLLITEANFIAAHAGGLTGVPGIWSDAQVAGWKTVTDAVHAKGSIIFCQLWTLGRVARRAALPEGCDVVSSGDVPLDAAHDAPRPLSVREIDEYVGLYAQAARNAVRAGFDGVEIHSANGFLHDQFLHTTANNRTDEYGGSVENRTRFTLRVARAVVDAIGAERTGLRLSPYERFPRMYMPPDELQPTFAALITALAPLRLAYLSLTERRVSGQLASGRLDWAADLWRGAGTALMLAGGYTPASAARRVEEGREKGQEVLIAFGRYFISNPDLVERVRNGIPFAPYHRPTFGSPGAKGYTDYPTAADAAAAGSKAAP